MEEITFLPHRLNKKAVVFNSMTFAELMIICTLFGSIGALVGFIVMLGFGMGFYIIFLVAFGFGFIGLKAGGVIVARIKRGKPDTYFERLIALKLTPQLFITASQGFSKKRSPSIPH